MRTIAKEKQTIAIMIGLYCRRKEGNSQLCPECKRLIDYAFGQLDHCRYGDGKPTCKHCPIHCYARPMRKRIREVMRWAGPRMILYHPIAALRHLLG